MRRQHDQHADKANDDGGPAVDADAFLQDQRSERHAHKRRGKRDRIGFDQRQARERTEIAEHRDDGRSAATDLAERPFGAHRRRKFAAPSIDQHDRHDGEGGAVKDHLTDRIAGAEIAHQRRHHGEQNRRDDLQRNAFAEIHGALLDGSRCGRSRRVRRLIIPISGFARAGRLFLLRRRSGPNLGGNAAM